MINKLFYSPLFILATFAQAVDQTWMSGNANNDWNTTTGLNWDAGVAWTQGNSAIFGGTGETVTLTEGISVDGITFNVANYIISGNTLTLGTSTMNAAANATISSTLTGIGATLNKTGAGQLTLTGNNDFDGGLTLSAGPNTQAAGAIQLSSVSSGNFIGQGVGPITLNNTASMTGFFFTGNSGVMSNPVQFSSSAVTTRLLVQSNAGRVVELSGLLSGGSATSAIRTDGTAAAGVGRTKVSNPSNTLTLQYWELWRGGLEFTSDGALGNIGNDLRMDVSTDKAGTGLMFGADNITLNAGRALNVVSGTVIDTKNFTGSQIDGVVTLNSIIYKRGTTGLTFTGTNTGNASAELRFMEPSTVTLGTGGATGDLHSATYVNFNGQTGSVLAVNRTGTLTLAGTGDDGKISGPGSIAKSGAAVLNLGNSTSDFSGGINITAGQVRATATSTGATGALGTGPITIANGAALHFYVPTGSSSTFANNIQLPSTGSQQFIVSGPATATTVRLTGQITGGGAGQIFRLVDSNVGSNHNNVLVLDNATNNFQGTIEMWRGTLGFTSDTALGDADNDIRHYTENLNGSLRFDADNIILNASRNIQLYGSAANFPFNTQGFTGTIDGNISGNGTVVKQGAGTLILNGNNSYPGATQVSAGTLLVNGTNNSTAGLITVALDATFGGTGTAGDVTVADGGFLSPGASSGTLTVRNLTLNPSSFLNFEIGAPNLGINPGSDHVAVQQVLTLAGVLNLTPVTGYTAAAGDRWVLATYAPGSLIDNGATIGAAPGLDPGLVFSIDTQTDGQVILTVVPEPAASALLGMGLLVLLLRRRTL